MAAITESEVRWAAALMRIDAGDAAAHVPKVQKMVGYFERLDEADLGEAGHEERAIRVADLRADEAEGCPAGLMGHLKGEGGEHVRSPGLR